MGGWVGEWVGSVRVTIYLIMCPTRALSIHATVEVRRSFSEAANHSRRSISHPNTVLEANASAA